MEKNRKDAYKAALIGFAVSAAVLAAMPYLSVIAIPAVLIIVPMMLIYAIAKSGYVLGGTAAAASFAVACIIDYQVYGMAAVLLLPLIFAAAYALRSKKRLRDSAMISAIAVLIGAVLAIGIIQMTSGMGIVDFMVDRLGQGMSGMSDAEVGYYYQLWRVADIMSGATTMEALQAMPTDAAIVFIQDMMRDALNMMFVLMLIVYSMVTGFVVYLIARAFSKKRGVDVVPIPRFADYMLPRRFWLAAILSILAAMLGENLGWASFDLVFVTIYYAYAVVFIAQGLCLVDFFMVSRKMGKGVRVLLLVLAGAILGSILIWVGLIENALGLRRRMKERWEQK